MPVKFIRINSTLPRIVLLFAGLLLLVGIYFSIKWQLGASVAATTEYKEIAEAAVDLAPSDPQARLIWASLLEKTFLPEDLPKSLVEYENAAALAPEDYAKWLSLGKARERNGDTTGAEKALRKARELAPHYAQISWTLGNLLLRQGKTDEGFAEIRQAAEANPAFNNPAVLAAWQKFDGDLAQTRRAVGDSPAVNSALAVFLARQKRLDESLAVWNSLPAEGRKTDFRENGREFYNQLIAAKKYRTAQLVLAQISEGDAIAAPGQFADGGFESDVKMQNPGLFEWQIGDAQQPQIGYDNQQKHGGERSLAVVFNSADGKDFRAVLQTVTVESGKTYELSAFYKSDLKTTSTFTWEIADAADGKTLAATAETGTKTSDWTNLTVKFIVPVNTEAIIVRLSRVACKSGLCPITGRILFDDFSLAKLD